MYMYRGTNPSSSWAQACGTPSHAPGVRRLRQWRPRTARPRARPAVASMGVKTVTVLASSEGGDIGLGQWSIQPSLQPSPGEYNHHRLVGLDFVLHEVALRGMAAVMVLNNAWPWSGGMGGSTWNGPMQSRCPSPRRR